MSNGCYDHKLLGDKFVGILKFICNLYQNQPIKMLILKGYGWPTMASLIPSAVFF